MIISSAAQRQPVLRAVNALLKPSIAVRSPQRRHLAHRVPLLDHDAQFNSQGIPNLLSREGYDIAWTQYHSYLVQKLNALTAGTTDEHSLTRSIALKYARDPSKAALFNYASMACNNHLFFSTISPTLVPMSENFLKQINDSFSSLTSFRATFLATADALFGPGFVWLVRLKPPVDSSTPPLAILTTYIAGSPFPGAHFRQQPVDMATSATNVIPGQSPQAYVLSNVQRSAMGSAGRFGSESKGAIKLAPGAQDLEVLMGVNTWEHVWLRDYGVGRKRQFLENWWERINWDLVERNMDAGGVAKSTPGFRAIKR
ncbi:hypothetical protein MMC13_006707 [Lambiella insularis]|nr:hypothetical protein [Lambiella insularis]